MYVLYWVDVYWGYKYCGSNIYVDMKILISESHLRNLIRNITGRRKHSYAPEDEYDKSEEERFTCSDCGNPDYRMYMVNDDIWNEFGNDRNTLCKSCLEKRMGRELTADDFSQHINAPVNKHNPEVQALM